MCARINCVTFAAVYRLPLVPEMHTTMVSKQLIQKLFWVALYSSPVISVLIITPVFIFGRYGTAAYPTSLLLITGLVLFMWLENIAIIYLVGKKQKEIKYTAINYVLSYFICVVVNLFTIQWVFEMQLHSEKDIHQASFHFHMLIFLSINSVILIIQHLLLVKEKSAAVELENSRLKIKNMEALNEQLKHQAQPHFLFNSLSTLKALIKTSPENAEEYLVKLSDFLRFSINSNGQNLVKVSEELKLCTGYLEMQKIRFGEALQFNINIPAEVQANGYVPVFALQVLVENAIKHNTLTAQAPLFINIVCSNDMITVENNQQQNRDVDNTGGVGLANLRERYRILSGGNIVIDTTNNKFAVSIKVLKYEDSNNRG